MGASAWVMAAMLVVLAALLTTVAAPRSTYSVVAIGFLLRLSAAVAGATLGVSLPWSGADAIGFESVANVWSTLPAREFIEVFNPNFSYVYSWFCALIYHVTGREPFLLQLVNVLIGTGIIAMTGRLVIEISGNERGAVAAAWFAALFPPGVFMSAVALREMIAILPFMVGLWLLVRWQKSQSTVQFMLAMGLFAFASLFHIGWFLAIIAVGLWCALLAFRQLGRLLSGRAIAIGALGGALLAVVAMIGLVPAMTAAGIGSNHKLSFVAGPEVLQEKIEARLEKTVRGDSAYPALVSKPEIWVLPLRLTYFLVSPMPWDIRSPKHVLGFASSGVFMVLLWRLFRQRRTVPGNQHLMLILFIVAVIALAFSIGTSNIGTAIRHRTKIFYALVVLAYAYPLVYRPRVRFVLQHPEPVRPAPQSQTVV